ncbi:thioredoxin TrxA [Streptomyces sp. NPDC088785]|uniref:thioredoxin TrxA n=1 Tax=Streptomyces sp. NPDC088785 TaxID=3365897 RepID=UPI0038258ECE
MADRTRESTDASFDGDVLASRGPVLVHFWAEWAGPCAMMAPLLVDVAEEYAAGLTVARHDIDRYPATGPRYGVRSVPTLLLFKAGRVAATRVGAFSRGQLTQWLDANL